MLIEKLKDYKIILASNSLRRQYLLNELGITFEIKILEDVDEHYPNNINNEDIPVFLAELKAKPFDGLLKENQILITADTVVIYKGKIIGKPENKKDAFQILNELSGKKHTVITGVCIKTMNKINSFSSSTNVFFSCLSNQEIEYYINNYKPFDKAGAYGIQEWIGYIGVEKIEGSYFNVMGLPIQKLYRELISFIN